MKTPQNLKKGDKVALVATARKVNSDELEFAIKLLKSWELIPVIGKSIGLSQNQFAGSDLDRKEDFQNQINNPEIKAIWCARGGYGTVRILDLLDFSKLEKTPKWIIGYSDITALHSHLHHLNIKSLHAEMPALISQKYQDSAETLKHILFGNKPTYQWKNNIELFRNGKAEGQLIGGNLSVLYSLCGSISTLQTEGKILFLEDLDEYLYHIDRMMQNLKRNHWFENLNGLIIGGMTDMNDNTIPFGKTAEEIIFDTVKSYNFPVCFDFPAGHLKDNKALIMGENVILEVENSHNSLSFQSAKN